ncbi:MAG: UDP-N-acetylmuramoyl-tripeptide--D-alanyl-D-alanine ligase, partial [Phycisphaerales bacterium]|nr:UDP-N-acetylmuramoyl-tripeptide--D-alanyl-D-alanine ligase [Phycisphaerales bacterium]
MPDRPVFDHEVQATSTTVGTTTDEGRGRMFPCEGCGADFEFHIGQQKLKCPYCGFEKAIVLAEDAAIVERDFRAALARLAELREKGATTIADLNEVRCGSCGSNVVFRGTLTSTECAFCGSPIQREKVHTASNRIPVDGVLPFQVDQQRAKSNLADWVRSRWFAPNEFRKRGVEGRFNGVYLPYWTFDSHTFNRYRGERGEHYYVTVGSGKNRRTERRTRWYPASGQFERFFDDVLVVGITGSVGKTSTKETVASVLARAGQTYRSPGNLNTEVGLPLSLSEVTPEHWAAVLEMGGAYALGEIRLLAEIARPRIGVVTNVYPVHLERMGSIEAIAETKSELVEAIPEDGWAILNGDDPRVRSMGARCRGQVIYFGLGPDNDVRASDVESEGLEGTSFWLHMAGDSNRVTIPLIGGHAVELALAAIAVGHAVG